MKIAISFERLVVILQNWLHLTFSLKVPYAKTFLVLETIRVNVMEMFLNTTWIMNAPAACLNICKASMTLD